MSTLPHNTHEELRFKLLLGQTSNNTNSIGFTKQETTEERGKLIHYSGDGHLCTVAPTRSGKGTGVCVPNLLTYEGPVVVFDPKGENYQVTAKAREKMGHRVICLDPFSCLGTTTDAMNPLDALTLPNADIETDSQTLAEMMTRNMTGSREPFWDNSAAGLISAVIMAAATRDLPDRRLGWAFDLLSSDDVVYQLAVFLDTQGKTIPELAYREISTFLQTVDVTRSGILTTAQSYIKTLSSSRVRRSFEASTFDIQDVVEGKPLSIYMILPGDRIQSHSPLLKIWLATLFRAILARKRQPAHKTLFLLDEMGQLGEFPFIESMITLCGGYGLWVWLIFQDIAQLSASYPQSWKTLLNNCEVLQVFGINNRQMATGWEEYFDSAKSLHHLSREEQLLHIRDRGDLYCRRINYLVDESFRNRFDTNRLYDNCQETVPRIPPADISSAPKLDHERANNTTTNR